MPWLPVNLFSGTVIRDSKAYICGKTNTVHTANDLEIATIDKANHMLFLRLKDATPISMPALETKISIRTLHRRLGHLGLENIKKTAAITDGITLMDTDTVKDLNCNACKRGKLVCKVSRKPQE